MRHPKSVCYLNDVRMQKIMEFSLVLFFVCFVSQMYLVLIRISKISHWNFTDNFSQSQDIHYENEFRMNPTRLLEQRNFYMNIELCQILNNLCVFIQSSKIIRIIHIEKKCLSI